MADKDLPRLRADKSFKALAAPHQDVLVDYCRTGKPDTPAVRETDAMSIAESLAQVDVTVRETFLGKLKEDSRRSPRLIGMTGTSTWQKPLFNGKPATGADVALCQRRLVQVFSLLRDKELSAAGSQRQTLLTNTVEWFIFANLRIDFAVSSDTSLMGEYRRPPDERMILYHESLLKIGPDKIGDPRETVRKLAHEVNHACRRGIEDTSKENTLVDELYAYVTELLAVGNVVTESQINETFRTLADPPYRLKSVINSPAGISYKTSIRYQSKDAPPTANPVVYPLPAPGTETVGWHHTNAVPGL